MKLCSRNMWLKVWFVCSIYHTSKYFCACVGACGCDSTPPLKGSVLESFSNLILITIFFPFFVWKNDNFQGWPWESCYRTTKKDPKGQEWLGPKGAGMTGVKYSIQPAKLDSLSCSNFFCLASCAGPDNCKRQVCAGQAFGNRKPSYSR